MIYHKVLAFLFSILLSFSTDIWAQTPADSVEEPDSVALLSQQLIEAQTTQSALQEEIAQLRFALNSADSLKRQRLRLHIDSLRATTQGALVIVGDDTLFTIYAKKGGIMPTERAKATSTTIERLGKLFTLEPDSVYIVETEMESDVMYERDIIISLSDIDALWAQTSRDSLATDTRAVIVQELITLRNEHGMWQLIKRILMLVSVILAFYIVVKLINYGYRRLYSFIVRKRSDFLKPLYIQSVELLNTKKQLQIILILLKAVRVSALVVLFVLTVPLVFSLFPATKDLAHSILGYIWNPVRSIFVDIIAYVPNLFTICVICIAIKYLVRFFKYLSNEVASERIKINGFFPEWALPTFYIIRFLLYCFMIAMIYPYLPGSSSGIFQGISVFVGVIVSLGSSNVIGNLISGLVITYMRPFKLGDRIEIKDTVGNVIEKNPLVTRIKTPKNEVVTIPNSFIMSSQTVNFSQSARQYGLIIHSDVTMEFDVPWQDVHKALIEAALNTPGVVDDPAPFVLQTALGDFTVVYQINAYIHDANNLEDTYSALHQNIQDTFDKYGLELLTPEYISAQIR